jgi:hypothetical protein
MAKQYFYFKSFLVKLDNFAKLAHRLFVSNSRRYLAGFLCLFCVVSYASAGISKENKLKAAYLLNFTKFIKWPTEGEKESLSSIRICAEESAEFIAFLSEMADNPIFKNREYEVKSLTWDTPGGCDLMYVTSMKNVDAVDLQNIVIVVNSRETYFPGTAIVFYEDNQKLRFEIDLQRINKLEVNFSSELLKLAKIRK